jgi:dihydrofolate reductase
MGTEQAVLLGRRTFEDFRGYWPLQTDDTTGVTEHFNRVVKYVVTRAGLPDPGWERTTVLTGSLVEQVGRLKEIGDGELVVTGSISLVHDLIDAGLVDEFRLFTYPVVVGRGRRLFRDGVIPPQLQLREAQAFGSGVLLVTYTVTG